MDDDELNSIDTTTLMDMIIDEYSPRATIDDVGADSLKSEDDYDVDSDFPQTEDDDNSDIMFDDSDSIFDDRDKDDKDKDEDDEDKDDEDEDDNPKSHSDDMDIDTGIRQFLSEEYVYDSDDDENDDLVQKLKQRLTLGKN
jgi:ribonuclease E